MNELMILACLMVPILILGIFGNLNLCFATIMYKRLHHRNGILVGIIAFGNLVSFFFILPSETYLLRFQALVYQNSLRDLHEFTAMIPLSCMLLFKPQVILVGCRIGCWKVPLMNTLGCCFVLSIRIRCLSFLKIELKHLN